MENKEYKCRTCLQETTPQTSALITDEIVITGENNMEISNLLTQCAVIEISTDDDHFPREVCYDCLEVAAISYRFKIMCEKSHATLKESFKKEPAANNNSEVLYVVFDSDDNEYEMNYNKFIDSMKSEEIDEQTKVGKTFKCELCPRSYTEFQSFVNHMNRTHEKSVIGNNLYPTKDVDSKNIEKQPINYSCRECKKRFPTVYDYQLHQINKHERTNCLDCGLNCKTQRCLAVHYATHNSQFSCKTCNTVFETPKLLKKHLIKVCKPDNTIKDELSETKDELSENTMAGDESAESMSKDELSTQDITITNENSPSKELPCRDCSLTFKTQTKLSDHRRSTHRGEKLCIECGMSFVNKLELHKHYNVHETFNCKECEKPFSSHKVLMKHLKYFCNSDQTGRPIRCLDCFQVFRTYYDLTLHRQSEHSRVACRKCGEIIHKSTVISHTNALHSNLEFPCEICPEIMRSVASLESHYSDRHPEFPCGELACLETFSDFQSLLDHNDLHVFEKLYLTLDCKVCDRAEINAESLKKHYDASHKEIQCADCGKQYNTIVNLLKHVAEFHNVNVVKVAATVDHTCSHCPKVFDTVEKLWRHRHLRHNADHKQAYCDQCAFFDTTLTALNKHLLLEHNCYIIKSHKSLTCPVCQKTFRTRNRLRNHVTIVHGTVESKSKVCEVCGRTYDSRNIKVHMRVHTGERPYKCEICPKAFSTSTSLNSHMNFHTRANNHVCAVCGQLFAWRNSLRRHALTHTDEKPFKCLRCDKGFKTRVECKRHTETHTGRKDFVCSVCSKAFNRKTNLSVHMRVHTGEKPYPCKLCEKTFSQAHVLRVHLKVHNKVVDKNGFDVGDIMYDVEEDKREKTKEKSS